MARYKILVVMIITSFVMLGCDQILEPVLFKVDSKVKIRKAQQEFDINIHTLTFDKAREANKGAYPRQLMITGSGKRANVTDEADFLTTQIPEHLKNYKYTLGYGDNLSLTFLYEFKDTSILWPPESNTTDYKLGIGDQLTFIRSTDAPLASINLGEANLLTPRQKNNANIISSKSTIGSNGRVLLLGIGNLDVENRTLDSLRTEVRNILIRNGETPNFQLEISEFKSKKALLTFNDIENSSETLSAGKTISLNNIQMSLQEAALGVGLSRLDGDFGLVTLSRNKKSYRFTAGQLLDVKSPDIYIQDKDKINIALKTKIPKVTSSVVGSNGKIILQDIGSLNAINRTLSDLHEEIYSILDEKGLKTNFQLDLTKFKSKKVYFVDNNGGSQVIPLTNFKTTLKDLILHYTSFKNPGDGLYVVTLKRNKKIYRLPLNKLLEQTTPDIWIQGDDQVEIELINYKPGQVYALNGTASALILPINPSKRETLANILFSENGVFKDKTAKRSEVYLLRGQNPAVAYHLDTQNVSRILVAAKTELRPNDIIYVAERPIISFSRVLAEITPLRILLRDIDAGNIP